MPSRFTETKFYQIYLIDSRSYTHTKYYGEDKLLADNAWNKKFKTGQTKLRIITNLDPMKYTVDKIQVYKRESVTY